MRHQKLPQYLQQFFAPALISPEIGKVIRVLIGTEIILWAVYGFATPLFYSETGDGMFPLDTPLGTIIGFALFGVILLLFHALTVSVHKRGVESMTGPFAAAWRDFKSSMLWVGAIALAVCLAPPFLDQSELAFQRALGPWLFWAALGVVFISIQAGTEEIIYRGYLMQQLAVYRPERWFWMWVPSIIFGVSHYFNGFGPAEGVFLAIWATFLGYACADLTARTGNIGAAIGLHTANNLYASLYVGVDDWPNSGLALNVYTYVDPASFDYRLSVLLEPQTIFELVSALGVLCVMWLAARIAIRA